MHAHEEPGLNHGGLSSVRRELAVPVTFGSRGRGALSLVSFAAQPAFGTAAIELGAALGRLVSLALESAETVERRAPPGPPRAGRLADRRRARR